MTKLKWYLTVLLRVGTLKILKTFKDFSNLTVENYFNKNRQELYATQSLELNPYATKSVQLVKKLIFTSLSPNHNFYDLS